MLFDYFENIAFGQPIFLWLLLLIPLLIIWKYVFANKKQAAITVPVTRAFTGVPSSKAVLMKLPFIFRLLALACIIIALARPQVQFQEQQTEGEGIDIILCIDVSGSMTAQDFKPNRMEAAKNVALDFISHRPTDRICLLYTSPSPRDRQKSRMPSSA